MVDSPHRGYAIQDFGGFVSVNLNKLLNEESICMLRRHNDGATSELCKTN